MRIHRESAYDQGAMGRAAGTFGVAILDLWDFRGNVSLDPWFDLTFLGTTESWNQQNFSSLGIF